MIVCRLFRPWRCGGAGRAGFVVTESSAERLAPAAGGPQTPWATVGGAILAVLSFVLIVLSGEFQLAWLRSSLKLLEGAFWLGLIGIAIGQYTRLSTARLGMIVLRSAVMIAAFAVMVVPAEWATRFVFRDVRSTTDGGYFARRALPTRTNSLGFRGPEVGPKSAARYRIAIIGDSFTWGQGLSEEQRFSNLLEQYLGPGYEVLNFGTPGHDMPEHLQVLEQVLPLRPDFVLLQLYINFFEAPDMVRPAAAPLLPWRPLNGWLMESSALYCLAANQWVHVQEGAGMVESYAHYMQRNLGDPNARNSLQVFVLLRDFIERTRAAGVPVGTVLFPNQMYPDSAYPFDYLHARLRTTCVAEKIPCLDLRPVFAHFADPRVLWVNRFDPHPNALANLRAATAILNAFRPAWRSAGD